LKLDEKYDSPLSKRTSNENVEPAAASMSSDNVVHPDAPASSRAMCVPDSGYMVLPIDKSDALVTVATWYHGLAENAPSPPPSNPLKSHGKNENEGVGVTLSGVLLGVRDNVGDSLGDRLILGVTLGVNDGVGVVLGVGLLLGVTLAV
jgi:hypothetical protein